MRCIYAHSFVMPSPVNSIVRPMMADQFPECLVTPVRNQPADQLHLHVDYTRVKISINVDKYECA